MRPQSLTFAFATDLETLPAPGCGSATRPRSAATRWRAPLREPRQHPDANERLTEDTGRVSLWSKRSPRRPTWPAVTLRPQPRRRPGGVPVAAGRAVTSGPAGEPESPPSRLFHQEKPQTAHSAPRAAIR